MDEATGTRKQMTRLEERYQLGSQMHRYLAGLECALVNDAETAAIATRTLERITTAREHFQIGFMFLTKAIMNTPEEKL